MHIVTLPVIRPEDILAVRAACRAIGATLGLDEPDQVRLATALSEVGREVLALGVAGDVRFSVAGFAERRIEIEFRSGETPLAVRLDDGFGIAAARRLVDSVEVHTESGSQLVRVVRRLPHARQLPGVEELVAAVRTAVPQTPLQELWNQNRELVTAFDELLKKQQELQQLNAELEETNRGVMAMYTQLSEELEDTNRGVVALYAELDEKSIQLQEASHAKSRFFAAVSHELRSPVNSIIGVARVILDDDSDPLTADQCHQIALMESSARDLLRLVNQLLDIAKAEAGRLEAEIEDVDFGALAAELRGSLRPLVDEQRVAFVTDVEGDVPLVETDRTLIGQILRNLLVNAVKYTEDGEVRLTITADAASQRVTCAVSDTGIGIAPENLDRVFEEFFQVRGRLQNRSRGTGLGLAHSRRLAEVLASELTVVSEPGRGSTFTLTVPVRWNGPMAGTPEPVDREVALHSVLIVDDDEAFRTALRGMLQGLAHRVVEAPHAAAAADAMASDVPAVVFLDLRMPDADGEDVLAWMGTQPALRDVPVVIVTSVDLGIAVRAKLRRAHALLAKSELTRSTLEAVLNGLDRTEDR